MIYPLNRISVEPLHGDNMIKNEELANIKRKGADDQYPIDLKSGDKRKCEDHQDSLMNR